MIVQAKQRVQGTVFCNDRYDRWRVRADRVTCDLLRLSSDLLTFGYGSTVMWAARMTSPQSFAWALMKSPVSCTPSGLARTKIVLSFASASGECMAATIALLSFPRTSNGVLGGAIRAWKVVQLKSRTPLSSNR